MWTGGRRGPRRGIRQHLFSRSQRFGCTQAPDRIVGLPPVGSGTAVSLLRADMLPPPDRVSMRYVV